MPTAFSNNPYILYTLPYMQLEDELGQHFRINELQKSGLKQLGINAVRDLLYHFPSRYENLDQIKTINEVTPGEDVILYGKVYNISTRKSYQKKTPIAEAELYDTTGKIKLIWFHQPYIAKNLEEQTPLKIYGRTTGKKGSIYMANPEFEKLSGLPADPKGSLFSEEDSAEEQKNFPVYPETKGVSSKWIYHKILRIFASGVLDAAKDPIPEEMLKKYNLPSLKEALYWIHTPKKQGHSLAAKKRFAFEEVFFIQLLKQKQRKDVESKHSLQIALDQKAVDEFIKTFPFTPTNAQYRTIQSVIKDFKQPHPMTRLLEGDVGSGKTAIAAATVYAVSHTHPPTQNFGGLQTAYMVPTEVLAAQHFESFIKYFSHLPVKIGLITSNKCRKFPSKVNPNESTHISKNQLLKWVENGEIPILIGTHSLIQNKVQFKNLAYVIIDEQHRFGTVQRRELTRKDNITPHLLSMTATPIPRTLALTIYGDLEISVLDEMPGGRKQVKTEVVTPDRREETYEKVRKELKNGRQAYVVCPRIDKPDPKKEQRVNVASAKKEAEKLATEVFPEYNVGLMHGKLKPKEKETVMRDFENNEIQILVSTSVVEVGVDVPNATVMMIEGAENFGLAQLHQLRGRVIRSTYQPYCYVFAESRSQKVVERLKALKTAKDGFELAEYDLKQRGAGELYGGQQWGISDIGMEAIKNVKMVEAARKEAKDIIENDIDLVEHPNIKKEISKKQQELHFE